VQKLKSDKKNSKKVKRLIFLSRSISRIGESRRSPRILGVRRRQVVRGAVPGLPRLPPSGAEDDLLEADERRLEKEAADHGQRRRHQEVPEEEVNLKAIRFNRMRILRLNRR